MSGVRRPIPSSTALKPGPGAVLFDGLRPGGLSGAGLRSRDKVSAEMELHKNAVLN